MLSPPKNPPAQARAWRKGVVQTLMSLQTRRGVGGHPYGRSPEGREFRRARASKFSISPSIGGFAKKSFFDSAQNKSDFVQGVEHFRVTETDQGSV